MRVEPRRIETFLRDPGPTRVVLLHGEDAGLIRERADTLTRLVVGALDDAFRVARLEPASAARLEEEASALSLIGGRRVVRVREAGDGALAAVRAVLDGPSESLIVLEAPGLPSKSKLRTALEQAPNAAVIACHPAEGAALAAGLRAMVEAAGCRITTDAIALLSASLGADRGAARSEVEKLVLYAGPRGEIDLDAVEANIADASSLSLDHALFAATAGDVAGADRAIERAIADGGNPVAMLRSLLGHVQRLGRARAEMDETGLDAERAAKGARPPVFFRHLPAFARALDRWTGPQLDALAVEAARTELACKRTGAPDLMLVRHLFGRMARQASRPVRGMSR